MLAIHWEEECRIQTYYPLLDRWKEHYAPHLQELLAKLPQDSAYLLYQKLLYQYSKGLPLCFLKLLLLVQDLN